MILVLVRLLACTVAVILIMVFSWRVGLFDYLSRNQLK